jgi:hypothetical protein
MHIGYVIAQRDRAVPWLEGRDYRGIDRLLPFPNPLELGDDAFGRTWSEYWDSWDSGELGRERHRAEDLAARFRQLGQDVEVIHGDIVASPGRVPDYDERDKANRARVMGVLAERFASMPPAPSDLTALGLDVSALPAFHSVIFQPGPGFAHDSAFASHLNEFGLIDESDLHYASDLMDAANMDGYLLSCFHVVRIRVRRAT